MSANTYPRREYFPRNVRPPEWVEPFVAEVRAIEPRISVFMRALDLLSALYASQRLPSRFAESCSLATNMPIVASATYSWSLAARRRCRAIAGQGD